MNKRVNQPDKPERKKCDHHWDHDSDGFSQCRKCKEVTKTDFVVVKKVQLEQCPLCLGVAENRKYMLDQTCQGCGKKYLGLTTPTLECKPNPHKGD